MTQQNREGFGNDTHRSPQDVGVDTCSLTTFDRDTGSARDVAMRFAIEGATLYLLSDAGGDADWVKNLLKNPEASLRIGDETVAGMGRIIPEGDEEQRARRALARKYDGWREGQTLTDWASSSLPVAVDLNP
jgi:deazaflavin-dependent oxidoreductase (nitroreductase family)